MLKIRVSYRDDQELQRLLALLMPYKPLKISKAYQSGNRSRTYIDIEIAACSFTQDVV